MKFHPLNDHNGPATRKWLISRFRGGCGHIGVISGDPTHSDDWSNYVGVNYEFKGNSEATE